MPIAGTTLNSLRPLIQGINGVVVSSHPSAAMIGLDILRQGGADPRGEASALGY